MAAIVLVANAIEKNCGRFAFATKNAGADQLFLLADLHSHRYQPGTKPSMALTISSFTFVKSRSSPPDSMT